MIKHLIRNQHNYLQKKTSKKSKTSPVIQIKSSQNKTKLNYGSTTTQSHYNTVLLCYFRGVGNILEANWPMQEAKMESKTQNCLICKKHLENSDVSVTQVEFDNIDLICFVDKTENLQCMYTYSHNNVIQDLEIPECQHFSTTFTLCTVTTSLCLVDLHTAL